LLDPADFEALAGEIPTVSPHRDLIGEPLVNVLVEVGLEPSKGAARRSIDGGGIYVNDEQLKADRALEPGDLAHGRYVMLRRGKKKRLLLAFADDAEV
jgi:tyrosyl-tRNA synthetase